MKPLLVALACVLLSGVAPRALHAAPASNASNAPLAGPEYIVVSGGPTLMKWEQWKIQPHDLWWMNFIRAARIRIQQLEAQGVPGSQITWLVYRPSYETRAAQDGQDLIAHITSVRDRYGVNLRFFRRTETLIDYLNNGQPRDRVKIADFEYFGHSNKACFLFDYSNVIDSASKVWLHESELTKIHRGIFTSDAFVKSWGCHTGESMSKKFRAATGIRMWGATGRSQYNTHELPSLATRDGRWRY